MIELKGLPYQERINISVTCEPFFLCYRETKQFKRTYDKILPLFPSRYRKEVLLVLTAFIKATKYGNKGVRFSLDKKNYVVANKIHKQKLSRERTLHVIDVLESQGYLTFYKGYWFSKSSRMTSCLVMTDKMSSIIDTELSKRFGVKREVSSYLEIKSSDDKSLLNISDFRGHSTVTKFMEKYNNLLQVHDVCMVNEKTGEMIKCALIYKRSYLDGLNLAGRFFNIGDFQIMRSDLRQFITIDSKRCTEVDFSNMFPRILYTLEGIRLPTNWDGYEIDNTSWISEDKEQLRYFLKESYLSVLFSETKDKAVKSVLSIANKNKHISVNNKILATSVVDLIVEKNKKISHVFFDKLLWAKLQYLESRIAQYVLNEFLDKNIIVLSWHDSFVMQAQYQKKLLETMREGWYSVFGTYMNVKLKIDY